VFVLQRFEGRLIGLWLYIIRSFFRRPENAVRKAYFAYSIGPEMLAIVIRELEARNDEAALSEATPLFHGGLKRIEVWCGWAITAEVKTKILTAGLFATPLRRGEAAPDVAGRDALSSR
jgi:hypothetical protein